MWVIGRLCLSLYNGPCMIVQLLFATSYRVTVLEGKTRGELWSYLEAAGPRATQ